MIFLLLAIQIALTLAAVDTKISDYLTSSRATIIESGTKSVSLGTSVNSAGDFNGDGFEDAILGAATSPAGEVIVLYGRAGGLPADVDIDNLDLSQGFKIFGHSGNYELGYYVTGVGDVNKDGCGDIMVVAYPGAMAYVIYGKLGGMQAHLNLAHIGVLSLSQGFQIMSQQGVFGHGFEKAGDFNGDGVDDILIAGYQSAYVIYGRKGGLLEHIILDSPYFTTSKGLEIRTVPQPWSSVLPKPAGDVNKDGVSDIILRTTSSLLGRSSAGTVYVIYGKLGGYQYHFNVSTSFNNAMGFRIFGDDWSAFGYSSSSVGDINKDGITDMAFAATGTLGAEGTYPMQLVYVIYGKEGAYRSDIDLKYPLDVSQGFIIIGNTTVDPPSPYDLSQVSGAGDFNNDSIDDIMIQGQFNNTGRVFIFYGKQGNFGANVDLENFNGIVINADQHDGTFGSIGSPVDLNNDGLPDLLIGTPNREALFMNYFWTPAEAVYVIYSNGTNVNSNDGNFYTIISGSGGSGDGGNSDNGNGGSSNGDGISKRLSVGFITLIAVSAVLL